MNAPVKNGLPHLPSDQEIALAKEGSRELSMVMETKDGVQEITVKRGDGEQTVRLPSSAFEMLMDILVNIGQGNAVQVVPVHAELTTQEAADLLMVSRPYLIKLLDENKIAYRKVGTHRRVQYGALLAFRDQEAQARRASLEALAAEAQELDMGY